MRKHIIKTGLWFTILCFLVPVGWARVFMTQEQALKLAFPDACSIERKTVFLSDSDVGEIQKKAKSRVESRVVTYYVGKSTDGVMGFAFFQTHVVRTMPEIFMAVVESNGRLRFVEILAFYEPEDYLPPKRWLDLLGGKMLNDKLWVKRGVRNIAGATLSTRAITAGIRRVLATFEVVVKNRRPNEVLAKRRISK